MYFQKSAPIWTNIPSKEWSNLLPDSEPILPTDETEISGTIPNESLPETPIFDFERDVSYQKYVSPEIHFEELSYIPNDLEKISGTYLIDAKGNQLLRSEALEHLQEMSDEFYQVFHTSLKIISAYRSYSYQVWIKKWGCSDFYCAKAWYSEHQTGLAVDFFEASDKETFLSNINYKKYFERWSEHAYKYWFTNSYQKGKQVDGYAIEPWHWRYVWNDLAKILFENKMTLSEYVNTIKYEKK